MRYLLATVFVCTLLISVIAHLIHQKQRSEAEQGAKDLHPYIARVEKIEQCPRVCYRMIVSYFAEGNQRLSMLAGLSPMPVGQTVKVWAKPNFKYAYISPEVYITNTAPSWSPTFLLLLPLMAILGGAASIKLDEWRKS